MELSDVIDYESMSNKKSKFYDSSGLSLEGPELTNPGDILEGMTQEQKETMSRAMNNPLVLHKIILALEFPELRLSRLVNKTWKCVSNEVMYKKDCCQMRMTYDETRKTFRRSTFDPKVVTYIPESTFGSTHLSVFNFILENSSDFPCSDIMFQGGDLSDPDPQKLLDLQGGRIRTLYLFRNSVTPADTFRKILLSQAPHVDNLTIAGFQYTWSPEDEFLLPKLKVFEWGYATPTARKILGGAVNLKIVKNFRNCDDVDLVTQSSTVPGIHALDCHENDKPETWTRLAAAGLRLRKLTFRICIKNSGLSGAFQDLLKASQNSLEFLELSEVCARTGTNVPPMRNLKTLEMGFNSGQRCFQPRINLSETFPVLQTLDCTGMLLSMDDKWEVYFPSPDAFRGSLPTVKTLGICDDATMSWMLKLRSLCPNFYKLFVQSEEDCLPQLLTNVFRIWPHLTKLMVRITNFPEGGLNLDSAFTGFTTEISDQLWSLGPEQERVGGFEGWRVAPSIVDLKGLKRLDLTMTGKFPAEMFPVSSVTGIYGLQLIPDLRAVIRFDHTFFSQEELNVIYTELNNCGNIRHRKGQIKTE